MADPFAGLRPHQKPHATNVLRALTYNKGALDASDTGVGKSYSTLAIARIFGCVPLILGPKGTRSGWEDASKVMGVPVQFINYEKARRESHGLGYEKEMFKRMDPSQPEGPDNPLVRCGSYWVWNHQYQMMVFDEAHLCGGSTTITGKLLRSSRKAADFVLALSATAADSAMQMKNIGQMLGLFDGKGYYSWVQRCGAEFDYTGERLAWTDDVEKQRKSMAKIHHQIFPSRGARLRRSDIPGFPQTVIDTLLLDPDKQIKGSDKAPEDLAERVALRQLLELEIITQLQGMIKDELEGSHASVAVFLNFTKALDTLSAWARKKNIAHGIIDGRQVGEKGDEARREVIRRFQSNEERLVLVNCAAGGAGLNLHDPVNKIERVAFIVPSETGRQMKQVVGRVHRDGGGFSRQFFCGLRGTYQEDNLHKNQAKIRNIDTLNGDDVDTLNFN
jgi:superfamily II DNA or RNA helicase